MYVAPRVGAWIETLKKRLGYRVSLSLPVWERGLKLLDSPSLNKEGLVAPRVGAWIETPYTTEVKQSSVSLPVWERGLKPACSSAPARIYSRSPCGSVD